MSRPRINVLLALAGLAAFAATVNAQRLTIPEAIARGGVTSTGGVPSGQPWTVRELLRRTDVIVMGTVGDPLSYLTRDELEIRTDYPLTSVEVIHRSPRVVHSGSVERDVTVTQLGGTALVSGVSFTQMERALPPLQPGMRGLFLLELSKESFCQPACTSAHLTFPTEQYGR